VRQAAVASSPPTTGSNRCLSGRPGDSDPALERQSAVEKAASPPKGQLDLLTGVGVASARDTWAVGYITDASFNEHLAAVNTRAARPG
jgi:hypothetical protein